MVSPPFPLRGSAFSRCCIPCRSLWIVGHATPGLHAQSRRRVVTPGSQQEPVLRDMATAAATHGCGFGGSSRRDRVRVASALALKTADGGFGGCGSTSVVRWRVRWLFSDSGRTALRARDLEGTSGSQEDWFEACAARLQTRYTTSNTRTYGATRMDRDTYECEEEGWCATQDSAACRLRARVVQRQRQRVLRGVASSRLTTGHECVSSRIASGF